MYTDETILPYGEYKNHKLKDIPPEYFILIWKTSKGGWDPLMREYLENNIHRIKETHWRTRGIGSKCKLPKNNVSKPVVTFICSKLTFATKKQAQDALNLIINKEQKNRTGRMIPIRIYECPHCSGWHHTSKSLSEFNKTVQRYKK